MSIWNTEIPFRDVPRTTIEELLATNAEFYVEDFVKGHYKTTKTVTVKIRLVESGEVKKFSTSSAKILWKFEDLSRDDLEEMKKANQSTHITVEKGKNGDMYGLA